MTAHQKTFGTWALLFVLGACYPEGPETIDDLDIVYTNYDPSFEFKSANTFAIPSEVIEITGSEYRGGDAPDFVMTEYRDAILASIRENMNNLGWTEVDKNDQPDVILLPSVSTTTYIYYYYDSYYWGWWYPWYYDDWSWYYPGYYYPVYQNGFRTGTLLIQMTDAQSSEGDATVPVRWVALINGILEGSTQSINNRLHNGVDRAFKQSPYLQQ